eukprot:CAMPEP_0197660596 /NCGR_PEP_ID=MMETSP1338-20131121/50942_1 /TAXON_ID=43686 ORGANISM="Pelagodinium beii, Strain RCC1491" /NCGR_SAMPLE_ID=MMETSP1338 /ASSEMBLY_ACC=CAM_ASM_000754 /LENGTH=176 /DNA_ID=CAMNT_0043237977 /DNA_START=102 /DNA_END=632 /DNA_ORIENTATION=-
MAPVSNLRPDPPKAPRKGPAQATFSVPPLVLPMVPAKQSLCRSRASTGYEGYDDSLDLGKPFSDSEDEDEEECMFALDGLSGENDGLSGDIDYLMEKPLIADGNGGFRLTSLDYLDSYCGEENLHWESKPGRERLESGESLGSDKVLSLGASPVLLSVLEQLAMEARGGPMRQTTI